MGTKQFRILAVDDEEPILDLYRKILSPTRDAPDWSSLIPSFDLTLCRQGEEAVEAVRVAVEHDRPFAMVFLNLHLPPGRDGVWTAEKIRNLDPDICIIFVTGYLDIDLTETAHRIPPAEKLLYLKKPCTLREIWQIAFYQCAKWQVGKELRANQAELESKIETVQY